MSCGEVTNKKDWFESDKEIANEGRLTEIESELWKKLKEENYKRNGYFLER